MAEKEAESHRQQRHGTAKSMHAGPCAPLINRPTQPGTPTIITDKSLEPEIILLEYPAHLVVQQANGEYHMENLPW